MASMRETRRAPRVTAPITCEHRNYADELPVVGALICNPSPMQVPPCEIPGSYAGSAIACSEPSTSEQAGRQFQALAFIGQSAPTSRRRGEQAWVPLQRWSAVPGGC
jgi:hypothetical protein